jgi:hypothetical protein
VRARRGPRPELPDSFKFAALRPGRLVAARVQLFFGRWAGAGRACGGCRGRVLWLAGGGFSRGSGGSREPGCSGGAGGGGLTARGGRAGPAWPWRGRAVVAHSARTGYSGHGFRHFVRWIPALCQIMRTIVLKKFHKAGIRRNNHGGSGPRLSGTQGAATAASQRCGWRCGWRAVAWAPRPPWLSCSCCFDLLCGRVREVDGADCASAARPAGGPASLATGICSAGSAIRCRWAGSGGGG